MPKTARPKQQGTTEVTLRDTQILVRPMVTEKTSMAAEKGNWIAFEVSKDATKPEIKNAVQRLFKVDVERVNTLIRNGKIKMFRGRQGRRSDVKIAYIRLKDGQSVDVGAGA